MSAKCHLKVSYAPFPKKKKKKKKKRESVGLTFNDSRIGSATLSNDETDKLPMIHMNT